MLCGVPLKSGTFKLTVSQVWAPTPFAFLNYYVNSHLRDLGLILTTGLLILAPAHT